MLRIGDEDSRTLCFGADVNDFERAFLQRKPQKEGWHQGNSQSLDVRIAHQQPIVDAQGCTGAHGGEFPAYTEAPVGTTAIAVDDATVQLQPLERDRPAPEIETVQQ